MTGRRLHGIDRTREPPNTSAKNCSGSNDVNAGRVIPACFFAGVLALLAACDSDSDNGLACPAPDGRANAFLTADIQLNPHGIAPLTAVASIATRGAATLVWTLEGRDGRPSDVRRTSSACSTHHEFEILGLYADHDNRITIVAMNGGQPTANTTLTVRTAPLPAGIPSFRIDKPYANAAPAFFLADLLPLSVPFIVDRYGNVRWYLLAGGTKYAIQRLRDGNLGFGISEDAKVVEYTMSGTKVGEWPVGPEFTDIHHDVFEKDNGNFLVTVNKTGIDTIEDFIIELDRRSGAIVKTWDLRQVLPKRATFIADARDWLHVNAVIHDPRDDSIIVSGQRQGVMKVTADNQLRWILAPPDGWAGLEQFLLSAQPSPEFEWNWGQHAPLLTPEGDLMLFDNGFGREYGSAARYSRMVRYRIVESAAGGGTVAQVWQYGKNRGEELSAPIVSDVDYLPGNTYLMTSGSLGYEIDYASPGNIVFRSPPRAERARISEVDANGNLLFEMTVLSDVPDTIVYRAEKLSLYP
jgi:arylsulfate sulfotransferase